MLTLSDRAYMPHARVDGVAMSDEDLAAKVHVPCPCGWRWGMTPLPSNRRHIPCPCGRRASANWMGTVNLDR